MAGIIQAKRLYLEYSVLYVIKKLHGSYDRSFFKINTTAGDFDSNSLQNFPFNILVFNSDYIKDNLNFSIHKDEISESKTILFEVGDNAKYEEKIIEFKNKIDLLMALKQ